jgi:hypothetical protein
LSADQPAVKSTGHDPRFPSDVRPCAPAAPMRRGAQRNTPRQRLSPGGAVR